MNSDDTSSASSVPQQSRRDLFRRAGIAAGGALLLGVPSILSGWTGTAEAALRKGSFGGTNAALELEGQFAGFLAAVEGGNAFADIITEAAGPDMIQRKRPGPVRFEDILMDVQIDRIDKPVANWLTETLTKNAAPKNGAIVHMDINSTIVRRLDFTGALITEVTLPDADAKDVKDPATMTLRLTPQSTRLAGGKGKLTAPLGAKTKRILSSNFRFNVQGLEKACARIASVEPIVVKRAVAGPPAGQDKFRQPSAVLAFDCSKVSITLPEVDAGPFYAWFDETVLKGKTGGERAGLFEWLDQTLKNVVASAQLGGLGIVRYAPEPIRAGGAEKLLGMVQVDMYCETVVLNL